MNQLNALSNRVEYYGTEVQGFLFSKPLPVHEIERLFLSGRAAPKAPARIVAA
jgi:sensor c-di-GMP phosphodiesterase-like protein